MINLNETLRITTTRHVPQLNGKEYKYYNHNFSVIPVSLDTMYIIKYVGRDYQSALHPFKARVMQ